MCCQAFLFDGKYIERKNIFSFTVSYRFFIIVITVRLEQNKKTVSYNIKNRLYDTVYKHCKINASFPSLLNSDAQ